MKNLIITFLLLTTLVSKAQEEFLGNWTSNGLATDVIITMSNKKIKVKSVSSTSGKNLKTTNIKYFEKILYLENYFQKNDWNTSIFFEYTNKNTLTAYLKNNNGVFEVIYKKIKNL
tara:strand:+ start:156 stop:503 length:348 start_codon:yes stop_codon:yes gene_type:complete